MVDTEGWQHLKPIAKREKKLVRLLNQARLRSFCVSAKFQYGFQVPKNYGEACQFDDRNGNDKWTTATSLEMVQMDEYDVFIDKGEFDNRKIPEGFNKIRVHFIFAVKHNGCHKAHLVVDGHLTDVPLNSVYSGVVSLRGLRMCVFLAELNGMEAHATDVENAYLEKQRPMRKHESGIALNSVHWKDIYLSSTKLYIMGFEAVVCDSTNC